MLKYYYEVTTEDMKSLPSEITVKEFEKIVKAQGKYNGVFMYYLDTFEVLGLSSDFVDIIDEDTLYQLIKDFNKDFTLSKEDKVKTIEIGGYSYTAFGGRDSISGRDLANIEDKLTKSPDKWIAYALAIIFKRDDLSSTEHKADAHIKHKEKLFADITMDIALPYIMTVSDNYIKNIKILAEG